MNNMLRVFALTAIIFAISSIAIAQNSDQISDEELSRMILDEIKAEGQQLNVDLAETQEIIRRINELKFGKKVQKRVATMVEEKDEEGLRKEFDSYVQRLEGYFVTDVFRAETLLAEMNSLFGEVQFLQSELYYYSGALEYYKGDDTAAVRILDPFFELYPDSPVDAKALAIILRSLINSNQEARAERDYILMYPDINSSEIDYLSGHIYFNLGRDSEARAVFTKCSSDEIYGVDSELMIALIDALEQTPAEALEQFALLNDVVTNNPFVILALARIYILNSEWEKAEEQYQRYYDLMRTQRVDFSAYERVLSLLNSGRKDEANTLLNELIQKKEYGDYYTTLLFIWAELQTDQGKRLDAIAKLDEYVDSLADNINLIPSKLEVLNMIIHAKERLYADPSQENLDLILKDFDAIEADLNTIHTTLLANPGAMNLSTLEGLHKYEKNVIAQFRLYFEAYVKANNLRNIPDQVSIDVVEAIEETYVRAELAYQKVKDYLEAIESRDLQLQRRKEVDQNIAAYDRILNLIEQTLANPEAKVDRDAWQAYFQEYSEKKAEVLELAEYYDYDDTFDLIRQEIDLFYEDKANYDAFAEAAKYNYRVTKPAIIANREMGYVREEIDRITVIPPEYARLLNTFESSLAKIRQDIQITELHLAYKELDKKNKERFNKNLTYEEGSRELADIINQMRALSSEMEEFITQNPDYPGMMQPVGFGHLTGIANLYYILGEMQYVIAAGVDYDMQAYYAKALDYYRLSVEKDPQFYMKDAALYNVGFLSSYLKGREFDVRYDAFYEANPNALVRPDDLRISEEYYAEAIAAYTEIVENYPSSVLFDEAVYLLGMLYFNIGSDALETTQYYARARDYFNILIARPESKYEYDALYRRAETYSFSNDEESFIKATEDFIALINAIGEGKITDQTRIVEYTNFASQYIPYCIVATDGADFKSKARGAEIITRYVSSFRNREILYMILDEVISRKMLLNAPRQAIDFMEARLIIDPLTLENPTRLDSIRTAYYWYQNDLRDNEDINTIISEIDNKMIQLFGYNSDWYVANKDKDISAQLVFVKRAFDDIEARLLARFDTEPSSGNILAYQNHITNYASFKELHGTDFEEWYLTKKQNVVSLTNDLAERTGTTQNYVAAISGIHAFNDTYQQNPRFFVNEGLAHQYAKYILDTFGQESHVNPIIIDSLGNQVVSADTINAYTYYRQIASRYLNVLVSEQYSSEENIKLYASLLLNLADMEYNRNDAAQAQKDYAAILALSDDVANPFKRWIYLQMAYMAENEKNYSVAEDWYKKAIPYATDDKDREEIRQSSIAMINESRKKAEVDNDYMKLALESLRMAESFEATDKEKAEIFKMAAQKAYKDGKEYQKSIGLLMEVASDKKDVKVVYAFYYDAWTIADSLMTNKVLADSLKQSFIGKFPTSNETFALRVQKLQTMAKNDSTKAQAGEMYLELHDEVVAKKIDSGEVTPEQIYLEAIGIFQTTADDTKFENLLGQFAKLYPANDRAITSLEILADRAFARKDSVRYEQLAREIFHKNPQNLSRYKYVAETKLAALETAFYNAYVNLDWTLAFSKRDEFKRIEAAYSKEGLKIDTKPTYELFARAEADHKKIEDRRKFLASYDTQLNTIENGFLKRTPAQLIVVNRNTSWKGNLTGGRDNRIPNLSNTVDAEVAKISKLFNDSKDQNLDNTRWLKGLSLIARINEHAAYAISTQIDTYVNITNEFAPLKSSQENVDAMNSWKEYFTAPYLQEANGIHYSIYLDYHLVGFSDPSVRYAVDKLTNQNMIPELQMDSFPLDKDWTIQVMDNETQIATALSKSAVSSTMSPKGLYMSSIDVPQSSSLVLKREITAKVLPEAAYIHFVYPGTAEILLNGDKVQNVAYVPVDTLVTGKPVTTRFSLSVPGDRMAEGKNQIELKFVNNLSETQKIHFAMQMASDKLALKSVVPLETVVYNTDDRWKTTFKPAEDQEQVQSNAVLAANFKIPNASIMDMEETQAKAIWVPETEDIRINDAVFEMEFVVDSEFRSGHMFFVAPDDATVLLNDVAIIEDNFFDYDPEPLTVYASRYDFLADQIKPGKNTIKFIVSNKTDFRGFLAEISITKTQKEVN